MSEKPNKKQRAKEARNFESLKCMNANQIYSEGQC